MEPIASTSALPYSPFPPPPATQQDLDCDDCLAGIALSTSATQDCPDCSPPSCCPPLPSFTDDCANCNVDTIEGAAGHLAFCCDDQSCLSPSFSSGLSLEAGLGLGVDDPDGGDASCSRGTESNSGAGKGSPKTWQQLLASCTQCHDHGEGAVSGSITVGQDGTGSGRVRRGTVADEWRLACKEAGCFDSFSFPPFATGSTTAAGSTGAAAAGVKDGDECPDCLSLPLSALASSSPHAPASASHCASFPFPLVPSISTPGLGLITSGDAHPAMSGHAACLSTSSSSGLFEPHAVVDEVGEGKGKGKNVAAGMEPAGNAAELEMDVEALLKGVDEETIREIVRDFFFRLLSRKARKRLTDRIASISLDNTARMLLLRHCPSLRTKFLRPLRARSAQRPPLAHPLRRDASRPSFACAISSSSTSASSCSFPSARLPAYPVPRFALSAAPSHSPTLPSSTPSPV